MSIENPTGSMPVSPEMDGRERLKEFIIDLINATAKEEKLHKIGNAFGFMYEMSEGGPYPLEDLRELIIGDIKRSSMTHAELLNAYMKIGESAGDHDIENNDIED